MKGILASLDSQELGKRIEHHVKVDQEVRGTSSSAVGINLATWLTQFVSFLERSLLVGHSSKSKRPRRRRRKGGGRGRISIF